MKISTDLKIRSDNQSARLREKRYLDHLHRIADECDATLLQYFGGGFFHDGEMGPLRFSDDFKEVSISIACPNIEFLGPEGSDFLGAVEFDCVFHNVAGFALSAKRFNKYNDPIESIAAPKYLFSEINTLDVEIEHLSSKNQREMNSLIIVSMPISRNISIVFERVSVCAREPLAFELIKASEHYRVPLYMPE